MKWPAKYRTVLGPFPAANRAGGSSRRSKSGCTRPASRPPPRRAGVDERDRIGPGGVHDQVRVLRPAGQQHPLGPGRRRQRTAWSRVAQPRDRLGQPGTWRGPAARPASPPAPGARRARSRPGSRPGCPAGRRRARPTGATPNQSGLPGLCATRQNTSRTPSAASAGLTWSCGPTETPPDETTTSAASAAANASSVAARSSGTISRPRPRRPPARPGRRSRSGSTRRSGPARAASRPAPARCRWRSPPCRGRRDDAHSRRADGGDRGEERRSERASRAGDDPLARLHVAARRAGCGRRARGGPPGGRPHAPRHPRSGRRRRPPPASARPWRCPRPALAEAAAARRPRPAGRRSARAPSPSSAARTA